MAKLLIENGAEINIKDSNGTLPIHWAAEHGIPFNSRTFMLFL